MVNSGDAGDGGGAGDFTDDGGYSDYDPDGSGAGDYADGDEEGCVCLRAPVKSRTGSDAPVRHTDGI